MAGELEWKRYTQGSMRLFDVLLQEDSSQKIFGALARIVGETLGVDRSMIFDISFTKDTAEGLTEWIDKSRPHVRSVGGTFPLKLFGKAAIAMYETRTWLESHHDALHPALLADGAGPILHGDMSIKSLLWYPFLFRHDGFFLLVFNHVGVRHTWRPSEIEFMHAATRHVSMALVKVALIEQRTRTEQAMFAAQKLESLGVLAGGVAHDFNNLMVGVVSNAELVARRLPGDSPLRELVVAIREAGERAAALASQLLAYAGKGSTELTSCEPRAALDATAALVRATFPRVPIIVTGDASLAIECNRPQLDQVLMNLLVNAAEAMTDRIGSIRVNCDVVYVDAQDAEAAGLAGPGRMVRLTVSDDGPGIDAATVDRIFDPFFTTKFAGRGLGLSAVQGIVRRHHGAVGVESTEGGGTTFTVLWPVVEGPATTATDPTTSHPSSTPAPQATPGIRVLAVDDEPLVLSAIRAILTEHDFECTTADGGAAALDVWRGAAETFDCVLLDLTMPAPSGLEVLRVLRAERADLPIVVMSGYSENADVTELVDTRTRFLRKPFSMEGLVEALTSVLHPR